MSDSTNSFTNLIGRRHTDDDWCALPLVRRLAALLNSPRVFRPGDPLPEGWHVVLFTPTAPQAALGRDGVAQEDTLLPHPTPQLPRKMLGGRRTTYRRPITIGSEVRREGVITAAAPKTGRAGRLLIVTSRHSIFESGQSEPAIIEEQDSIYREPAPEEPSPMAAAASTTTPPHADISTAITFDTRMLFRYCAITFNAHRIHYDQPYVTRDEGYPNLLVNGGFPALLLLEMLRSRCSLNGCTVATRNLAPVYCGEPIRLCAASQADRWTLWAEDASGRKALEMDVVRTEGRDR